MLVYLLTDLDVHGAVIGHSERRQYFNETDAEAARQMAGEHGLMPQAPQTKLHRDKAERLWTRIELAQGQPGLALQWLEPALARAQRGQQRYKLAELLTPLIEPKA